MVLCGEVAAAFSGSVPASTAQPRPTSTVSQWLSRSGYTPGAARNARRGEPTTTAVDAGSAPVADVPDSGQPVNGQRIPCVD